MKQHKLNYILRHGVTTSRKIRNCLLSFVLVLAIGFWLSISVDEPQRIVLADQHRGSMDAAINSARSDYAHMPITSNTQVSIRDSEEFAVNLTTSYTTLSRRQTADVVVVVKDSSGQPAVGELVTFFGSLGVITPDSVVTNEQGEASASYQAVAESGTAVIQALIGSSNDSAEIHIVGIADPGPASTPTSVPTLVTTPTPGSTSGKNPTTTPKGQITPASDISIYLPFINR